MTYKRINILKEVSLFSALDEGHLKEIAYITSGKLYKKNETIFHQGDPGSVLFILESGIVKISLVDSSGKEVILKMLYENDFFGEMSLLDGNYRSATITAVEDSMALKIYRNDFVQLIQKHPSMALNMLIALSRRLRKADEKIASLSFFDSYGRVAKVLLDLMAKDEKKETGDPMVLDIPFSRQELANMAGITRETFTRILHDFQLRGCLRVDGKKVEVLDEVALKREII